MKKLLSKSYQKVAQMAHSDFSSIDEPEESRSDYYNNGDPSGTSKYKGKWVPHIRTDRNRGYIEYEISIIREDYKHGFDSYGWGAEEDDNFPAKIFVSEGKILTQYATNVIKQIESFAQMFANSKNQQST